MKNNIQYPDDNLVASVLMNDYYQYAYETMLKSVPLKTRTKATFDNPVKSVLVNDCYQYIYESAG